MQSQLPSDSFLGTPMIGMPIIVSNVLPWRSIIVNNADKIVIVGELGELLHQLKLGELYAEMRDDLRETMSAFERRVLL
jgi:hypothetical protein